MLKMCSNSISNSSVYELLEFILGQRLETSVFPTKYKKANVVPFYTKDDKQILKTTMQIFFEKLTFRFFMENDLISANQSGFKPRDSCINLFLSITSKIYKLLIAVKVRCVSLDISKAFDKI